MTNVEFDPLDDQDIAEAMHHECDLPQALDKEAHFSEALRALIESVLLDPEDTAIIVVTGDMLEYLERTGRVLNLKEYEG